MRAKLAAAVLALSLLSAPFIATPSFAALSQDDVVAQCKISAPACKTAVAQFIAENKAAPNLQALVVALVKTLSTDTSIPGANVVAGVKEVVAETTGDGALVNVFNETQLTALGNIEKAVVTAGGAIQTADLPSDFSES